jgi:5-methylcytosine-specific restriction endonuclease McrA
LGLFDLDIDPITGKKIKSDAQIRREALTPAKRRRIMESVGFKCEIKRCRSRAYEVHHITPISEGGRNIGSNLIVLCANHHRDAHNGKLSRAELRRIVRNRTKRVKDEIKNILKDRKRAETSSRRKKSGDRYLGHGRF